MSVSRLRMPWTLLSSTAPWSVSCNGGVLLPPVLLFPVILSSPVLLSPPVLLFPLVLLSPVLSRSSRLQTLRSLWLRSTQRRRRRRRKLVSRNHFCFWSPARIRLHLVRSSPTLLRKHRSPCLGPVDPVDSVHPEGRDSHPRVDGHPRIRMPKTLSLQSLGNLLQISRAPD